MKVVIPIAGETGVYLGEIQGNYWHYEALTEAVVIE